MVAALYLRPIHTGIFALGQRFGDVGSTKPPFGSLFLPNGTHGNIFKKRIEVFTIALQPPFIAIGYRYYTIFPCLNQAPRNHVAYIAIKP